MVRDDFYTHQLPYHSNHPNFGLILIKLGVKVNSGVLSLIYRVSGVFHSPAHPATPAETTQKRRGSTKFCRWTLFFPDFYKMRTDNFRIENSLEKISEDSDWDNHCDSDWVKFFLMSIYEVLPSNCLKFDLGAILKVISYIDDTLLFLYRNHVYKNVRAYFSSQMRKSLEQGQALNSKKMITIEPVTTNRFQPEYPLKGNQSPTGIIWSYALLLWCCEVSTG